MADESSDQPRRESPVADRLSHEGLESAFRTLGNETRLEVLSAILDADGRFASFSEIQDGISTDDSGNLVYHLDELTGRFVEHEDGAGYSLLPPAYHALAVVHMGTLAEDTRQISAPIDEECPLCGELLRFTYEDDHRGSVSCEGCSTTFKRRAMVPPVSIADREPLDAAYVLDAFVKSDVRLLTGSICPYCRGRVQHAVLPAAELEETIRTYDRDESDGAHVQFDCQNGGAAFVIPVSFLSYHLDEATVFFDDHGRRLQSLPFWRLFALNRDGRAIATDDGGVRFSLTLEKETFTATFDGDLRPEAIERTRRPEH